LNASLVEHAEAGSALGGSGDFVPGGEQIVLRGVLEAGLGDFRGSLGGDSGADAFLAHCRPEEFVDEAVGFPGVDASKRVVAGHDEGIGPIFAVGDDSPTRPAPDGFTARIGGDDGLPAFEVAVGDGGEFPAVDAQDGLFGAQEEDFVHSHVDGSPVEGGGFDQKL